MAHENLPDDVRRFVIANIPSVPYLEALLMIREQEDHIWQAKKLAQRLYVGEKVAAELLEKIKDAGFLVYVQENQTLYRFTPQSDALKEIVGMLDASYKQNIIEISTLIHSKTAQHAQQFADEFKWRKES